MCQLQRKLLLRCFLKLQVCLLCSVEVRSWSCSADTQRLFVREIQETRLTFQVKTSGGAYFYKILSPADVVLLAQNYFNNSTFGNMTVNTEYCSFVGNASGGQLSLNLNRNNSVGIYRLENKAQVEQCVTVYILGKPTLPTVIKNGDPVVGQSVTLSCTSNSTTIPGNHSLSLLYSWIVDGSDIPSGSRYSYLANNLTMSDVVKEDNRKQFACTAAENVSNGYTSDRSRDISISVLYGPVTVSFSPTNTTYVKEEGTVLRKINCSSDCNPPCSFKWTHNETGREVGLNGDLDLGELQASEAGTYICTARWTTSFRTNKLAVFVIYGPYPNSTTLDPQKSEYKVNEDGSISSITCHAKCYPECEYKWTKKRDDSTVAINQQAVLTLGTVRRSDAATYVCESINQKKGQTDRVDVLVIVYYGPDACEKLKLFYTYTEGEEVPEIVCPSDCYPGCTFAWSNESGMVNTTPVLSLGSIRRHQAGIYTYQSFNKQQTYGKSVNKTFRVVVNYAPVVKVEFSTQNYSEGSIITLLCKGEGVPIINNYTGLIQKVGQVKIPNPNSAVTGTEANSSLHFRSLQLQDTGNYTCMMNNGIRDLSGKLEQAASAELLVEVQPKILEDNRKYAGAQGNSINVQVPFYCYPVVLNVTFIRYDGIVIRNNDKYRTSVVPGEVNDTFYSKEVTLSGYLAVLVIHDLMEEDFANYTLAIHNSRGTTSELIFIVAESIPSIPKSFFLSSTGLLFIWEKGFNGGHLQTFIIQVSAHGKEEWQNLSSIHENEASQQENSTFYSVEIRNLDPGTYSARLIAANSLGETEPLYLNTTFTVMSSDSTTGSPSQIIAAAAGGTVSALAVVVVVGVVVIMWRRRAGNYGKETSKLQLKKHGTDVHENDSDNEDVEVENPMYVSAGPQNKPDHTVYATANKKSKPKSSDVYAVVNKPKPANKKKKAKQAKSHQEGDIYENAPKTSGDANTYGNAAFESTPYETTEISAKAEKSTNEDGLMYVDIAFSKTPKGKKLVIHGLDDRTPYAQVDFTKHAEPLPESDTEEPEQTPKN